MRFSPNCAQDLANHGISTRVAAEYLTQKKIDGKDALIFENDLGGYVARQYNPKTYQSKETYVNPNSLTVFPAKEENTAIVFDHFLDFLVYIQAFERKKDVTYIVTNNLPNLVEHHIITKETKTLLHAYRDEQTRDMLAYQLNDKCEYGTIEHLYSGFSSLSEMAENKVQPNSSPRMARVIQLRPKL